MIRGTYYGLRIKNVHWRLVCTISNNIPNQFLFYK